MFQRFFFSAVSQGHYLIEAFFSFPSFFLSFFLPQPCTESNSEGFLLGLIDEYAALRCSLRSMCIIQMKEARYVQTFRCNQILWSLNNRFSSMSYLKVQISLKKRDSALIKQFCKCIETEMVINFFTAIFYVSISGTRDASTTWLCLKITNMFAW